MILFKKIKSNKKIKGKNNTKAVFKDKQHKDGRGKGGGIYFMSALPCCAYDSYVKLTNDSISAGLTIGENDIVFTPAI